jgi:hypothetical protein
MGTGERFALYGETMESVFPDVDRSWFPNAHPVHFQA